jgi:hypothetical protein
MNNNKNDNNCLACNERHILLLRIGCHGAHSINNIDDALGDGQIAFLGLISQRAMLVKADLMIVCVALAC